MVRAANTWLSQRRDRLGGVVAPNALFGAHTHLPILRPPRLSHTMSLADASEARKARLLALRKRRAGEGEDGAGYGLLCVPVAFVELTHLLAQ